MLSETFLGKTCDQNIAMATPSVKVTVAEIADRTSLRMIRTNIRNRRFKKVPPNVALERLANAT